MTKVSLLLTVFLTPLIPATALFGYEQIKVLFFIVGVSIASIFWIFEKKKESRSAIFTAGEIFIVFLAITSVFGINSNISILGAPPYFQGFILYAYLFLFYILVKDSKIKKEVWSKILVGSAILVSLLAIRDWVLLNILGINVPLYAGRVISSFGQPNFFAGFLLLTLPFSYRLGRFGLFGGLMSFVGILVSYSRSTILLALFLLILGLIYQLKIRYKLGWIVLSTVLISIFIAWKFSSGIVGNEISKPIGTINPDLTHDSIEKRAYIWPQAWKLILQKPLTGYGLENINQAFQNYFTAKKHVLFEENLKISPVLISLKDLTIDRTHNYILDLLLFSGVLGLLSWFWLVILLLKKAKGALLLSLVVYLIWIQVQNQSVVQLIFFWLLAGLIDKPKDK